MSEDDKIIHLAHVNNSVATTGAAARQVVASFLRDWAEALESGAENAEKAILVLYDEDQGPGLFRLRTRRCNVAGLVEQVGLMKVATDIVSKGD